MSTHPMAGTVSSSIPVQVKYCRTQVRHSIRDEAQHDCNCITRQRVWQYNESQNRKQSVGGTVEDKEVIQ